MFFEEIFLVVNNILSLIGVLIIAYSAAKACSLFLQGVRGSSMSMSSIRLELGCGMILGLEFIVAGDIISSIAKPTYYDVGMLAALVLIRTFLSYFLNQELEALTPDTKETVQDISK